MSPLVTCLACLPVPKSSLLPTRNFLSVAVSPYCSVPSTLLSQDLPASHPPYHLLLSSPFCLISSSGPGRALPIQSGRVLQLEALSLQRLLFFVVPGCLSPASFQLSFMLCLSQSTAEVCHGLRLWTILWAISYTPISGDLVSSSLKATSSFHHQPFLLVAPCLFLAKTSGI